jgi:LuxR family maltose regulon positive regulatory protein
MPKAARYLLLWRAERRIYEFREHQSQQLLTLTPGGQAWFAWLERAPSFTFQGQQGQLTVRKESRQRGDRYWYAYHRIGHRLMKKYLGRTTDLTVALLEEVAALLTGAQASPPHQATTQLSADEGVPSILHSKGEITRDAPALGMDATTVPSVRPGIQRDPLLFTKLHIPRPRAHLVPRSHLMGRLQHGLECSLTLVSAPAGFGKTTLLAQWLAQSTILVAWLSLEAEDNDPTRFLSYLITALQTLDAQLGTAALDLLHTPQPALPEVVLTVLTNDLVRRGGGDVTLVLDDYHLITADPVQRAVTFLLEHLPPQLHLVLVTRADPPLPLARLRAQGQLCEVRAADLRFDTEEVSTFLQAVMGLDLPPWAISSLQQHTEGWIAGLQLAALSLQGRTDISGFLAAFTGSHRFVLDYLSEEVLARQDASVRQFLLHTCLLERLSGPLCDAVRGQEGSQAMLEALERANLFVVALDDERHWYRYHHLFAQALHSHLQQAAPDLIPELHRRASTWYEQHALPAEAVQHALAVPDLERAASLIELIALPIAYQGQISTVLGWLNALPETLLRTCPFLGVYYASLLVFTNQLQEAEARLQEAEEDIQKRVSASQAQSILGWVLMLRGSIALFSGDIPRAVSPQQQALELLPEAEVIPRAGALAITIRAFLVSGDVTSETEQAVVAAVVSIRASGNLLTAVSSLCLLGRLYILQGRLRQATAIYAQVAQVVPRPEVLQTAYSGLSYYFGLGDLLRECNDLESAERHLLQGMALVKETVTLEPFVAELGYTALARLQWAHGNISAAYASLNTLMQEAERRHFPPDLRLRVEAMQAQLELAQGNLAAAIRWANTSGLAAEDDDPRYPHEGKYLALARVRIAQSRSDPTTPFLQGVLHLLDRLLRDAHAKARMGSELSILVLRVLALEAQGDRASALSTLQRVLVCAQPEGYMRLFIDEGEPMRFLLRQAQAHGIASGYVSKLLSAFAEQRAPMFPPLSPEPSSLVEPLTEREREVLGLLLEGASNREIARRLVVSVNTVKRHVYNLCGKMGVQSRMQAIIRARDLNLF